MRLIKEGLKRISLLMSVIIIIISSFSYIAYATEETSVDARFYVVKRGGSRTNYNASNYISLGKGQVINPVKIYDDEQEILNHIVEMPSIENLELEENERVLWYSLKKEADGWHVDGEIVEVEESILEEESETIQIESEIESEGYSEEKTVIDENTTEDVIETVTAEYYVVKQGGSRTNYAASNYISLGSGTVINPIKIYEEDTIVEHLAEIPDLSTLNLSDNQKVYWYSLKKEADGWHVDGEIVEIESDNNVEQEPENSDEALNFVRNLGAGWNLGNALCCADNNGYSSSQSKTKEVYYETLWGNPVTSKAAIVAVKNAGFNTVRIPITYRNHVDDNFIVDEAWLDRIETLVGYVLENDMYCIINMHHENWLVADASSQETGVEGIKSIWQQVATRFAGYDNRLIFEGFNEVINSKGQWDVADAVSYQVVNVYNQTFVDTVRAIGGNNTSRYLIVNTYAAKSTESVLSGFVLPYDIIDNRLIVGVHVYDGIGNVPYIAARLNKYFISDGVPVVIGEWGLVNSATNTTAVRSAYAQQYLDNMSQYGIPCIWWDDGGIFSSASKVYNYAILNRNTCQWYFPELVSSLVDG